MTKPVANLTITRTPTGNDRYELFVAGTRVWLTHARSTVVERDGAKGRMQRWLAEHPHTVVLTGALPAVAASRTDEQQIAFWREFEIELGGRLWSLVEELLGTPTPRPSTISGWDKLFQAAGAALAAEHRQQAEPVAA